MKTGEIIQYIIGWLKNQCNDAGRDGFVVGVSGGVDSAVTSTLCGKTSIRTLALTMPMHQAEYSNSLADSQLRWLEDNFTNIETRRIDLSNAFDEIKNTLPPETHDDLTMANTRARLRMLTLYSFASARSSLVVGTGNKVEDFGVGFFTKYGDGGVDISPIGDLLKSEVREMAGALGINDKITNALPTDGLWDDNRSDADQLGASYDELEWAMDFDGDPDKLKERKKQVFNTYRQLQEKNRHKMIPVPVAKIPPGLR